MTRPLTLLMLLGVGSVSALAADHTLGTWGYNAAKSKPSPGSRPFKSLTLVRTSAGDGIRLSAQGETAEGGKIDYLGTYRYDGVPTPLVKSGIWDTISAKQVDADTVSEERTKTGGKFRATAMHSVSADGKAMIVTVKGVDGQGNPFTTISVFDKQ